jgi:hypothetical protein
MKERGPALRNFLHDWQPLSDAEVRLLARFSADDGDPCPKSIIFWVPGDEEYSFVDLRVGDTLHVVRGEG